MVVILCTLVIAVAFLSAMLSLSDSALRGMRKYRLLHGAVHAGICEPAADPIPTAYRASIRRSVSNKVVILPARKVRCAPLRDAA